MTSPGDDGLEEALRRALSEAASEVEPATDGLDKIRARIGNRPPRSWLFSVLAGLVDRVRHWTWRGHWAWPGHWTRPGHWAWPGSLPGLRALQERRSRRTKFPGWGTGWLRLVTVLAGIAVLASIALGVQPVRHAILQASSSLNGGGGPVRGSARTEGNGTQPGGGASGSTPTVGGTASGGGQPGQAHTTASGKTAVPNPTSSTSCVSTALPAVPGAKPSQTGVTSDASGTARTTEVPSPLTSGSATRTQPYYEKTNAPTCPVTSATRARTPAPTSSQSSQIPTPSGLSPTQASAPTGTDPSQSPTPTPTPTGTPTPTPTPTSSSPTSDPPSSSPSDLPTWIGRNRQHTEFWALHPRRH